MYPTQNSSTRSYHIGPSLRNRIPILLALRAELECDDRPISGYGIDFSAGSGAHLEVLAPGVPELKWLATEFAQSDEAASICHLNSIAEPFTNTVSALALDLSEAFEIWPQRLKELQGQVHIAQCVNVCHITPWEVTLGLLQGAQALLKPDGILAIYGPFRQDGSFGADSNRAFDERLRARDSRWGIRDLEAVAEAGSQLGLSHSRTVQMPANNLLIVFRRS